MLLVTGCLAQRYRQEILEEIPEVDAVVGTTAIDKIADAIEAESIQCHLWHKAYGAARAAFFLHISPRHILLSPVLRESVLLFPPLPETPIILPCRFSMQRILC